MESQGDGNGMTGPMYCSTMPVSGTPVGACGGIPSQSVPNCAQPVAGQAPSPTDVTCFNRITDYAIALAQAQCNIVSKSPSPSSTLSVSPTPSATQVTPSLTSTPSLSPSLSPTPSQSLLPSPSPPPALNGLAGPWASPAMPVYYNTSATRATLAAIDSCAVYAEGTVIPWPVIVQDWATGGGRPQDCAAALIIASGETSCTKAGCLSVHSGIWQVTSPDLAPPSGCANGDTNTCCNVDYVRNHITTFEASLDSAKSSYQIGCVGEFNAGNSWAGDPTNPTHTLPPSYPLLPSSVVPSIVPADHSGGGLGGTQSNWIGAPGSGSSQRGLHARPI